MTAPPIDLRPYARMHSVAILRDLIRKWWKLELFLLDADGEPVPRPEGEGEEDEAVRPFPPDNDFCRLALHAPAGARRCAESARVALDKLRSGGRAQRTGVHECHLGFDILAAPLWLEGRLCGAVAVSGLIHEPWRSFGEAQLLRKIREVVPAAGHGTDMDRALRKLPLLARGEIEQVEDLLSLCADEIAAHHGERQRQAGDPADEPDALVGSSLPMQELLRQVEKIAGSELPLLIVGEPGAGKERCARLVHERGPRQGGRFQVLPCAALPAAAVEAALFAARADADLQGTLYLDEPGAVPPAAQERLLSALRGQGPPLPRIIAGTTRDLPPGALWEALGALRLRVPPLRERAEDVPLLCAHFLRQLGAPPLPPGSEVLAALERYPWPGNVRELHSEVRRLLSLAPHGEFTLEHLSPRLRGRTQAAA